MKAQFLAALNQICAEKNIPEDVAIQAVKTAIATAWRKDYGNKEQEIEVVLRDDSDTPTILLIKEVVDEVENENFEISIKEAQKIKGDVEVGEEIKIDVTPLEFGRIAAQSAKQVILQKLSEAERSSLFQRFKDREDQLLTASVNRIEGSHVFLEIEKTTVLLHPKHQIPGEKYFPGKRMKVYLSRVEQTTRGPQLAVSRTSPRLVELLMSQEIPEIEHGEVRIVSISRDAGSRSKIAVTSDDSKIDPVGACIGQKGARIHPVMDEIGGERVDVIEWDEDSTKFIARALQPAKIRNVVIVTAEEAYDPEVKRKVKKRAAVFVDESERAIAVGKQGQNVRLASELVKYELDMYNAEEYEPFKEKLAQLGEDSDLIAEKEEDSE
ncbi:MAG: transcription termination factor NusA [Candidatus Gracilibacteria bacterium]|jgi:N utilization substance protein A|nr:transcription termination factor NusA [Candidatus Gracilibacteria bacterium]